MKCDNNHEMTLEEIITNRTTSPLEEDTVEIAWWCEICQESKPLEKETYDEN